MWYVSMFMGDYYKPLAGPLLFKWGFYVFWDMNRFCFVLTHDMKVNFLKLNFACYRCTTEQLSFFIFFAFALNLPCSLTFYLLALFRNLIMVALSLFIRRIWGLTIYIYLNHYFQSHFFELLLLYLSTYKNHD